MKGNSVLIRIGLGVVLAITGFNILCVCIKDILPIEIRVVLLMVMPFLRLGLFVCLYWLLLFNLIRKVESVSYSKTFKYFICIAFALCTFFFIFVFYKAYAFWNFRQNFEKIVLIAAIPFFLIWSAICVKTWLTIIKRKDRKISPDCIEDEPAKSGNKAKKISSGVGIWLVLTFQYVVFSFFYFLVLNVSIYLIFCLRVSEDLYTADVIEKAIYETWREETKSYWADTGLDYTTMGEKCNFFDFAESEFGERVLIKTDFTSEDQFMEHIYNKDLKILMYYDEQTDIIGAYTDIPEQDRVCSVIGDYFDFLVFGGLI